MRTGDYLHLLKLIADLERERDQLKESLENAKTFASLQALTIRTLREELQEVRKVK